jgi:hypothetical protein
MESVPRYWCYQYACGFKISLTSDYSVDGRPTLVLLMLFLVGAAFRSLLIIKTQLPIIDLCFLVGKTLHYL